MLLLILLLLLHYYSQLATGLMIAVSLIGGLCSVHLDYQKSRLGLSIRSVLMASVYEKVGLINQECNLRL